MSPPAERALALRALRAVGDVLVRLPRTGVFVLLAAWMAMIWALSSLPAGTGDPTWYGGWKMNLAHAPVFGFLALWAALLLPRAGDWPRLELRHAALVLGFVLVYAIVDELHQASSPGRDPSALDVVTDLVGASCVLWIAAYVRGGAATERGLRLRLVVGVILCVVAAGLATFAPVWLAGP